MNTIRNPKYDSSLSYEERPKIIKEIKKQHFFCTCFPFLLIAFIVGSCFIAVKIADYTVKRDIGKLQYESSSYTEKNDWYEREKKRIEKEKNPDSYIIKNPETPYVGMPESMINSTKLGHYDYKNEGGGVWGMKHVITHYSYYDGKHLLFSCKVDNGVVSEVNDYRNLDLYSTVNHDKG